jgi:hypothetical protein
MIAGLDRSAENFTLVIEPAFYADIGSAGSPLEWAGAAGADNSVMARGGRNLYLKTSLSNQETWILDSQHPEAYAEISGKFSRIAIKSGRVVLLPETNFAGRLFVDGVSASALLYAEASAEISPTFVVLNAGRLENQRAVASGDVVELNGGELTQKGLLKSGSDTLVSGGYMIYNPTASASGQAPNVHVNGGTFDISQSTQDLAWGIVIKGRAGRLIGNFYDPGNLTATWNLEDDYPDTP